MSIRAALYAHRDMFIMLLRQYSIDKPIKGKELAEMVDIPYVSMRKLAAHLTCQGFPIGSDTERGYYWARTPEEMDPKIHHLNSRIVGNALHLKGAQRAKRLLESASTEPRTQLALDLAVPLIPKERVS